MKESVGNTEVVRSLRFYKWRAHKLPDVLGSRFTDNKPYDIVACSPKGRFVAIEGKLTKKWEGFSGRKLRPHQVIELDGVAKKCQGRAFVFLYVRINADRKTGQKRVCKLVVFDWKKHRAALMGKGYGVALMRSQAVGVWFDPIKDDQGKLVWPIKKLLKLQ
jgi:hypothetical protein